MRFLVSLLILSALVATVLAGNFRKTPGEVEYGAFGDYEDEEDEALWESNRPKKVKERFKQRLSPQQQIRPDKLDNSGVQDRLRRASASTQTLSFVKLFKDDDRPREEIDELNMEWSMALARAHVKANGNVIDNRTLLYMVDEGRFTLDIMDYLLEQPEVDFYEWDQKKYFPKGRSEPLTDEETAKLKAAADKRRAEAAAEAAAKKQRAAERRAAREAQMAALRAEKEANSDFWSEDEVEDDL